MKKNVSGQSIGVQMISSSDGSAFTSTVTVYVTGDAGGQAIGSVASGVCTHEGNGYHTYLPSQAETNYNIIAFTFIGTGAIPVTIQVETGFPQTVDNDVLAAGSTGFSAIDTVVDTINTTTGNIETDTQDIQTQVGTAGAGLTAINLPNQTMDITGSLSGNVGGIAGTITTLDALDTAQDTQHSTTQTHLTDVKGATWATTDSLEAIRDRGDAAWTTGAGGSDRLLLADTTIATLASQTSFTLTAGSADNDAYNNCTIVVEDASTSVQKSIGMVLAYVGATRTVTLKETLTFTIATTDKIYILAENSLKSTVANRQIDIDANGYVERVVLVDTTTANTDLLDTEVAANQTDLNTIITNVATVDAIVDAIKVKTDKMIFTKPNELDVNAQSINGATVTGDGNATPWDGV